MPKPKILTKIKSSKLISRTIIMVIGALVLALNYNFFLLQNDLVVGGTSGIGIILHQVFSIDPASFIFISGVILIVISYIFLGVSQTNRTIVGALLYPIFIKLTAPLITDVLPSITFESQILTVLVAGILLGLGNGLVYKAGFTTGGSDVIIQIINKYLKVPTGKSVLITNVLIICIGGFVFGTQDMIYSILVLIISSMLIDRILIGISDSKMFFIYSRKINEVEDFIINKLNTGVTIFSAEGGYSKNKKQMIMCVVPTRDYYYFKEAILKIDANAFFVISDCYEVSGGVKRSNLPFI